MTLYETIEKNEKEKPNNIACEYFRYKMSYKSLKESKIRAVVQLTYRLIILSGDTDVRQRSNYRFGNRQNSADSV